MQTEVCLVLPLFFALAFGGAQHSKTDRLPGFVGSLPPDRIASSPCANYTVTRSCTGRNTRYYYYRLFRFCMRSDSTHCGDNENGFSTCDDCFKRCNVSVCTEETTPPPMELPKVNPLGR
ncbi:uncharacterized protein LOC142586940 [Dermacentor variabilis]|uniref:uncharacterized protein LOC142586940 n=1 Tax=Dermacentor variabilis TaxID=34621 RepID=UPI003F5C40FB